MAQDLVLEQVLDVCTHDVVVRQKKYTDNWVIKGEMWGLRTCIKFYSWFSLDLTMNTYCSFTMEYNTRK